MMRTVAALGLTRNEQAQGQAEKGFEEAARARARTTTAARGWTAETGADVVRLDDDEPGSEETRADDDDTGQGAGGEVRGRGETTAASGDDATSSGGEDDETGEGGAVAMDEGGDEVDMEREGSGDGGAGTCSSR